MAVSISEHYGFGVETFLNNDSYITMKDCLETTSTLKDMVLFLIVL